MSLNNELYVSWLKKRLQSGKTNDSLAGTLLDSSLISPRVEFVEFDTKVIDCGQYKQIYFKKNSYFKQVKDKKVKDFDFNVNELVKKDNYDIDYKPKEIETRNINRSKFKLQRLAKSNEKEWKTFVTLTFSENLKDVSKAQKYFDNFRTQIKKKFPDFKYIAIPEFQKRGAVHYHLMTNIEYDSFLLSDIEKRIWKPKKHRWYVFKTIQHWNYGFSNVIDMKDFNVVGYLTKYMTKDIDNRLWGKRRYYYSSNLVKPVEECYNSKIKIENFILDLEYSDYNYVYSNEYKDYFGNDVVFIELKKEEV